MANNITAPHLWDLDTAEEVKAKGARVWVSHVHYQPAAVDNDLIIQEYDASGTAKSAIVMKAGPSVVLPIDRYYNPPLNLNGLAVGTIDGGHAFVTIVGYDPQSA